MSEARIPRIRRTYNKWVANQTLEDYALRFTAYKVRRFSHWRIANTAIGALSFLALEAIGAAITLNYGFSNAAFAVLATSLVIFLAAFPISYYAAAYGVDIDLLTRGAGFGYIGSTTTSLIYASFTFIFFAIEAAIVAKALELLAGVPLSIGYVISALVVIPLVTHGVSFISRFQAWTQPFWVVLQLAPFVFIASMGIEPVRQWAGYTGLMGDLDHSVSIAHFGAASAVLFSLIAQIGEQVDYLRFLPKRETGNRLQWWSAMLSAGPGWILIGALKIMAGSFLAFFAFQSGVDFADASDPTHMYLNVFRQMLSSPEVAIGITGIFVVLCQLKINVTNSYAGSIAWSNFFSRLTHSHPGRVVWVVFNVLISLLLMEFGIYKALENILGLYSIVAVAWVSAIVSDLVINKPLGLSPKHIEFRRAHLYDINPVGFGSMWIAIAVAMLAYFGLFGETMSKLYSYVALVVAFGLVPVIAFATGGRYYMARQPSTQWDNATEVQCCICEYSFDPEDMSHCPAYSGPICSLCCSLDTQCGDLCKTDARMADQIRVFSQRHLPERIAAWTGTSLARYIALMAMSATLVGIVFAIIYFQTTIDGSAAPPSIGLTLTKLFVIILVISGVVVWLYVLAQDSRRFAEKEARRHTQLLMTEIEDHQETDRQLQEALEIADSANQAKSRYVVGLSHELRTPLNVILGYAQLLERVKSEAPVNTAARTIRRSGEHLASMIEGLLDISKIEAGKIEIYRDSVSLRQFLDQLVDMFSLQAEAKGIGFQFDTSSGLPGRVRTDEKRLRQILINLLSNAVKFTADGEVRFTTSYRSEVATFVIEDTGIGIDEADLERIFLPFERAAPSQAAPGTGLGLTITKLLVEIMGGDLEIESTPGRGTKATLRIMLPATGKADELAPVGRAISGYQGPRKTIILADDDLGHRELMQDLLRPLGFRVFVTDDGPACLSAIALHPPDLVMLDVCMPGASGWDVAKRIKTTQGSETPVLMVSADAGAERNDPEVRKYYDAYLIKPFVFEDLVETLGALLDIQWNAEAPVEAAAYIEEPFLKAELPREEQLAQLDMLVRAGLLRSAEAVIRDIERESPETARYCSHLNRLLGLYQTSEILSEIRKVRERGR
ncbi:MAG: ATP-binding protein [Alphaproteobacteria bacterium]